MIIEIEAGILPKDAGTVFVVTTAEDGRSLLAEGIGRGRIWSPKELEQARELGLAKDELRALMELKLALDCRVAEVRRE